MNVFYFLIVSIKALKANYYYLSLQGLDANAAAETFNFMDIVIYIVLGISVLINIILLFSIKKKNRRKRRSNLNKSKGDFEDYYNNLDSVNNRLKRKIIDLENNLISIQNRRVSDHKRRVDNDVIDSKKETQTHNFEEHYSEENSTTVELEIRKPNAIYLPSPFEDNRFSIEDVSNEQTSSSLYQIILDASNINGELRLIENADFTRALNSPDHYLEKACIYENAFNPNTTGINVVESGKVKLENQDWLITDKIKIKFI